MGRFAAALAAITLLAGLMAGCLGGTPLAPAGIKAQTCARPWDELGASVYDATHDHTLREIHTEVSCGLQLLAAATLSKDNKSLGEYGEADVQHGLLAVEATTGAGVDTRVVLLDENALPKLHILGQFDEPGAYGDVKIDHDLNLVYVPYPGTKTSVNPQAYGFSIWDITDATHPKRIGSAPGSGCHMLNTLRIGGVSYVWCAALSGPTTYRVELLPDGTAVGVPISSAIPQSDPEVARYLEYYAPITPQGPALLVTPHDQTAQLDPFTGKPILVTAHELQGLRVFDVSDPRAPIQLSVWRGDAADAPIDRIHTAALVKIGDRRIGFGATETFSHTVPKLYVVDFTDYAHPKRLTTWSPPGIPNDQGLTFSLHNFQVVGTRLYIGNFHGGMWALDVSNPAQPAPIALRTPVRDTDYPRPDESVVGIQLNVNMVWDVIVANGYVLITDISSGVEVLHVDGDPSGNPDYHGFL